MISVIRYSEPRCTGVVSLRDNGINSVSNMPPECTDFVNFDSNIEVTYSKSPCLQILPTIEQTNYTILHESPAEYLGKCCDKKVSCLKLKVKNK